MKELEEKLNKEYSLYGKISIDEMHEEILSLENITYIDSIIDKIEPLDSDEPIIVGRQRYSDKYKLIDGYHRLKNKIINGGEIKAIVLDYYDIQRNEDTLLSFLTKTIGKTINFIENNILTVDNQYFEIINNEGCGGCSSGWSSLEVVPKFINKKLLVKTVTSKKGLLQSDDEYNLYINNHLIAKVDTGYGNGYYGGDFDIVLIVN